METYLIPTLLADPHWLIAAVVTRKKFLVTFSLCQEEN